MYKLIIQDDEGETTVVPVVREQLTIGRHEGNTICLTERNVSRHHAKLVRLVDEIEIEDLGSYNGVLVNGARITGTLTIGEADRVQIGDYLIEVKTEADANTSLTYQNSSVLESDPVTTPYTIPQSLSYADTAPIPVFSALESADATFESFPSCDTETTEKNGRMVVLSTAIAGREFDLAKDEMIIGRTEENELWINHRSISRHHAKIVKDEDNYTIVDLDSANGVRVNGEEYRKVELRSGDIVDLGHVRMRFVGPDEDFVFARDVEAIKIDAEERSGRGLWAVLFLMAALGVIGVLLFGRNMGSNLNGEADAIGHSSAVEKVEGTELGSVVLQKTPEDAAIAVIPEDANTEVENQIQALLIKAVDAEQDENWEAMAAAAQSVLDVEPSDEAARELVVRAGLEIESRIIYNVFKAAVRKKDVAKIAASFSLIDEESIYKKKSEDEHLRVKSEYQAIQLRTVNTLAKKGSCRRIERAASKIPVEWSDVAKTVLAIPCQTARGTKLSAAAGPKVKTVEHDVASPERVAELIRSAKNAMKIKQYGLGLRLCSQALESDPKNQEATSACAIAACNLKKGDLAAKYLENIESEERKRSLQQICITRGITGLVDKP